MNEKYNEITEMLKKEKNLYLQIHHYAMSGGLKNARYVAIFEPNPHEGKLANPEAGMDQHFSHGPYWERSGFDFKAKDTLEGLSLLERSCKGEKEVKSTVKEEWGNWQNKQPAIPGRAKPQDGIDAWIFEGYQFTIQDGHNGLKANMSCYFFETNDVIISSNKVKNVDEGIDLYQNKPVTTTTLHNLRRGLILDAKIKGNSDLIDSKPNLLAEQGFKIVQTEFMQNYLAALDELRPFDISNQCKNALFVSMVLSNFYKTDKKGNIE